MKTIILLSIILLLSFLKSYAQSCNNNDCTLDYSVELSAGYGMIRDNPSYNVSFTLYTMHNRNFIPTFKYAYYDRYNALYVGFTSYDDNTSHNTVTFNLDAGVFFTDETFYDRMHQFWGISYGIYAHAVLSYYIYDKTALTLNFGVIGMETINLNYTVSLSFKL